MVLLAKRNLRKRTKDKADAPNYRRVGDASLQKCATCAHFKTGRCDEYDFPADPEYTCDSWRPAIEALKRARESQKAVSANPTTVYGHGRDGLFSPAGLARRAVGATTKPGDRYRSIRRPRVYEALRRRGLGKARAAAISNATTKDHSGAMVAFFLPATVAEELALSELPEGAQALPAAELHITLAYLGEVADIPSVKEKLLATLRDFAGWHWPIKGRVNGGGRFASVEEDGTAAFYATFDAPELPEFRQSLVGMLQAGGVQTDRKRGFIPHITLAYLPPDAPAPAFNPASVAIVFDELVLAWGDERHHFRLGERATGISIANAGAVIIRDTIHWPPRQTKEVGAKNLSPLLARLKSLVAGSTDWRRGGALAVFKQKNGRRRWVAISSNAYRDRDRQIVSTKALAEDVARADRDGVFGPLRFWHLPGADLGRCDFNMMHGKMLVESGLFDNERVGARVAEKADRYQVSIGFLHPKNEPDSSGVFHHVRRFERSLVPAGRASNPFTTLTVKERDMSAEKLKALKALLEDESLVASVLAQAETAEKQADGMGIAFKDVDLNTLDADALLEAAISRKEAEVEAKKAKADGEEEDGGESDEDYISRIVGKAMEPYMKELKGYVTKMAGGRAEKEADTTRTLVEGQEAHTQRLAGLETTIKELTGTLAKAQADLAELRAETPPAVANGYRPSQDAANVVAEKQANGAADDYSQFIQNLGGGLFSEEGGQ